jgi:hypothetical protein
VQLDRVRRNRGLRQAVTWTEPQPPVFHERG